MLAQKLYPSEGSRYGKHSWKDNFKTGNFFCQLSKTLKLAKKVIVLDLFACSNFKEIYTVLYSMYTCCTHSLYTLLCTNCNFFFSGENLYFVFVFSKRNYIFSFHKSKKKTKHAQRYHLIKDQKLRNKSNHTFTPLNNSFIHPLLCKNVICSRMFNC